MAGQTSRVTRGRHGGGEAKTKPWGWKCLAESQMTILSGQSDRNSGRGRVELAGSTEESDSLHAIL